MFTHFMLSIFYMYTDVLEYLNHKVAPWYPSLEHMGIIDNTWATIGVSFWVLSLECFLINLSLPLCKMKSQHESKSNVIITLSICCSFYNKVESYLQYTMPQHSVLQATPQKPKYINHRGGPIL